MVPNLGKKTKHKCEKDINARDRNPNEACHPPERNVHVVGIF